MLQIAFDRLNPVKRRLIRPGLMARQANCARQILRIALLCCSNTPCRYHQNMGAFELTLPSAGPLVLCENPAPCQGEP
jgi:hypothetical protein